MDEQLPQHRASQLRDLFKATQDRFRVGEDWANVERVLEVLNEMRLACWLLSRNRIPSSIHEGAANIDVNRLIQIESELASLRAEVLEVTRRTYGAVDGAAVRAIWAPLLDSLSGYQRFIPIFTANYDWAIEELCITEREKYQLIDGFTDARGGTFDCSNFNQQLRADTALALFKFHGSTNWYRTDDAIIKSLGPPPPDQPIVIRYPGARRDVELGDEHFILEGLTEPFVLPWHVVEPFDCLFSYFSACLQQAKVLLAIGYSFGDDEINSRISALLEANSELELVVMLPEMNDFGSTFYHLTEVVLQGNDSRVSYVRGRFGTDDVTLLTRRVQEILS